MSNAREMGLAEQMRLLGIVETNVPSFMAEMFEVPANPTTGPETARLGEFTLILDDEPVEPFPSTTTDDSDDLIIF